ncbi:MAG: helix-turn-helix domain-containing protein [Chitinophagaceae bacterium]|nr:helix-turn-helix domain-containing protein [Chitinophagaceae bacterium]
MRNTKSSSRQLRKTVVIVAMPGSRLLDIAGPGDVFSMASAILNNMTGMDAGGYKIVVASAVKAKHIVTASGMKISCDIRLTDIDFPVDTLLIGGAYFEMPDKISSVFYSWLRANNSIIRRMGSVCVGAFILAKAGLLDHKRATTHWEYCTQLQADYPLVKVDSSQFFVKDGKMYTSGGITSGMDLALALVEEDLGRAIALQVARKLVLPLRRAGNQLQFGNLLLPYELKSPLVRAIRQWVLVNLDKAIRVEQMAAEENMSPRNFARVFLKETGLTPAKFVEKIRIEVARQHLEDSTLSMEQIAERCGLGNPVSMRRVFLRHLQISPGFYRNAFWTSLARELA